MRFIVFEYPTWGSNAVRFAAACGLPDTYAPIFVPSGIPFRPGGEEPYKNSHRSRTPREQQLHVIARIGNRSCTSKMRLIRRKSRTNRGSHDPENPFSNRKEPEPQRIELDLESEPMALLDPDAYFRTVRMAAQRFPWFGENYVAPAQGIGDEIKRRTMPGLRRVLVSYLAGRPMSSVAARVPTSRRTAYQIIRRVIYSGWGDIDTWTELGLIRIWDIPEVKFDSTLVYPEPWFKEDAAPAICLACHRLIGHAVLTERLYDSSFIENNDRRIEFGTDETERIRGHLIAHFHFDGRPAPNESFETKWGWFSTNPGKSVAQRWMDLVDPLANGTVEIHRRLTRPVVDGRPPTDEEIRRYYRALL